MFWADTIGLDVIHEALVKYQAVHGTHFWRPSPLLAKLAAEGKGFKDWAG
jgi:3-hydroxyacyl-CoA dehydrogenase